MYVRYEEISKMGIVYLQIWQNEEKQSMRNTEITGSRNEEKICGWFWYEW